MISNSQSVSAANGHCCSHANGSCLDPADVRDALEPGLFRMMGPMQARR